MAAARQDENAILPDAAATTCGVPGFRAQRPHAVGAGGRNPFGINPR